MADHPLQRPPPAHCVERKLSPLVALTAVAALIAVNVAIVGYGIWGAGIRRGEPGPRELAAVIGLPSTGQGIYMTRCFWCHGAEGRGNGPSAVGMFPRPRDFVQARYKIRSTPHGQLPTDDDLFDVIADGLPDTPMSGWREVLSDEEIRRVVRYVRSLSPRFRNEQIEPLTVPDGEASVGRGESIYVKSRCFMCHGDAGRGDGGITTALNYQWGIPHRPADLSRGWTFKGGHEPREIYLRITGGLNGTPMGPYQQLLSDQERWDLAHYVASLDHEPVDTSDEFVLTASRIESDIPLDYDAAEWHEARPMLVPLGGQVVVDPPSRWWTPTTGSASIRSLINSDEIGFLVEWNDPTGQEDDFTDAMSLQFAARPGGKPYFLLGQPEDYVVVWRWQNNGLTEEWRAGGVGSLESRSSSVRSSATWEAGRWHVVLTRRLAEEPNLGGEGFVPMLLSIQDGANVELSHVRAISTWFYVTVHGQGSIRPWLTGFVFLLAVTIGELWILAKLNS